MVDLSLQRNTTLESPTSHSDGLAERCADCTQPLRLPYLHIALVSI